MVRILPGAREDPIKCKLFIRRLDEGVAYEALSYCAGDPNDCSRILLNGFPFNTFHSTFEAIKRFRHRHAIIVMWIDQICIDQTDIEERDFQVLLMRDIYKHAVRTQIWLGEAASDPPNSLAFDLLNGFLRENRADLHEHIMRIGTPQPGYKHTGDRLRDYLHAEDSWHEYYHWRTLGLGEGMDDLTAQKVYQWFHKACNDPSNLTSWYALFQLFNRPWWRRCWIVQEAAVSRGLMVNCGSNSVAWEDLCLLFNTWHIICATIWNQTVFRDNNLGQTMRSCHVVQDRIHTFSRASTDLTLECRLRFLRENLASDPRDKIYSILGMLADEARQNYAIVPNYARSNTIVKVYVATAIAILQVECDLSLLVNIRGLESENGSPSWVPDWSQPQARTLGNLSFSFKAGIDHRVQAEVLGDGLELKLHGSFIGAVEAIGPVDSEDALEVLTAWKNMFVHRLQHKNDLCLLDAFYRTLTLDMWKTHTGDPQGDPKDFRRVWNQALRSLCKDFERMSVGYRFFVSRDCLPGMAPQHARDGDVIFIPWGSRVPFVIRRCSEQGDRYQLIGPCYLHGMMQGEVFKLVEEGRLSSEAVYLV